MQVCLSMYDLLLPPGIKGLIFRYAYLKVQLSLPASKSKTKQYHKHLEKWICVQHFCNLIKEKLIECIVTVFWYHFEPVYLDNLTFKEMATCYYKNKSLPVSLTLKFQLTIQHFVGLSVQYFSQFYYLFRNYSETLDQISPIFQLVFSLTGHLLPCNSTFIFCG